MIFYHGKKSCQEGGSGDGETNGADIGSRRKCSEKKLRGPWFEHLFGRSEFERKTNWVFTCVDKIFPANAEKIDSWKEHFINERSKIWLVQILLACNMFITPILGFNFVLTEGFYKMFFVGILPWTAFSCLGYFSKNLKINFYAALLSFIHILFFVFATSQQESAGFAG